jgi:hypothetical protein
MSTPLECRSNAANDKVHMMSQEGRRQAELGPRIRSKLCSLFEHMHPPLIFIDGAVKHFASQAETSRL